MAYTIVIASRYLIPLFLYLFLSCSIYALFVGDVRKQSGAAALQMVFLFLMQFTAWLTIVIRTQQSKYLLFYAFLQILTLALPVLAWFIYPGISRIVMNHMCMLFSAGLIVLTRLDLTKAIKQLIIAGASFVVFLIVPWILRKCRFLEKLGWIYAGIGIAALGIVLILGQVTHGSKLSWSIGGITFQPSEFVKLTFVFFSGSGSFRKDRNPAGGRSWNRSNSACADSRTVEGSGQRVDSFYGVCVSDDDFCTSATVSGWRTCRRGRSIVACVPDVFPCTGTRAGVERSMECD